MDEKAVEELRLRYRREAKAAIEEEVRKAREECLRDVGLRIKTLEDDVRKWKAVVEATSVGYDDETGEEKESNPTDLIRYIMETVYRDLKRECEKLPHKNEALAFVKRSLRTSTDKLMERIPTVHLVAKSSQFAHKPNAFRNHKQDSQHCHGYAHRPRTLKLLNVVNPNLLITATSPTYALVKINVDPNPSKSSRLFGKRVTMYEVATQLFTSDDLKGKEFVEAPVHVQLRRYSDFVDYHNEISKKYRFSLVPNLPPKQSNLTDRDVHIREINLKLWLQYVLMNSIIQSSSLTKTFTQEKSLSWDNSSQSVENGLPAVDYLYEIDSEDHKTKDSLPSTDGEKSVSPVLNKYTDVERYKCLREMHTVSRDIAQLTPNIESAAATITSLIDYYRDANKVLSKVSTSLLRWSAVDTAPFESTALQKMSESLSLSVTRLNSFVDRLHFELNIPFQFLEVETMKSFRSLLQSVQQRSVDCAHSRSKSEKYLKIHAATVNEWISFRRIRQVMLTENFLQFAEHMAEESHTTTEQWKDVLEGIAALDASPEPSNLKELLRDEKTYLEKHAKDMDEKFRDFNLSHANATRATIPTGKRNQPSSGWMDKWFGYAEGKEPVCEDEASESHDGVHKKNPIDSGGIFDSDDDDDQTPMNKAYRERLTKEMEADENDKINFTTKSDKEGESKGPCKRHDFDEVSDDDVDTPMNRAYKERMHKELQNAEDDDDKLHNFSSENNDEDFSARAIGRRRMKQSGGGQQRRLKTSTTSGAAKSSANSISESLPRTHHVVGTPPTVSHVFPTPRRRSLGEESADELSRYVSVVDETRRSVLSKEKTSDEGTGENHNDIEGETHTRYRSKSHASSNNVVSPDPSRCRRNTADTSPYMDQDSLPDFNGANRQHNEYGKQAIHPLPDGWEEVFSSDGHPYYYHKLTRKSQWDRPVASSEGEEVEQSSNNSDHNADSDQKAAPVLSKQEKKRRREREEANKAKLIEEEQHQLELDRIEVEVKALINAWVHKPTSTPTNPKLRTVPELLVSIPDLLCGKLSLPNDLMKFMSTLCNVSPPSDVKKCYMKIVRIIHPDKMTTSTDLEMKVLTENIFIHLSQQYILYRKANGL